MDLIDQTWIGQRFVGRLVTASSGGRVHDIHAGCEALAMIGSQLKEHGIVKEAGVFRYLQIWFFHCFSTKRVKLSLDPNLWICLTGVQHLNLYPTLCLMLFCRRNRNASRLLRFLESLWQKPRNCWKPQEALLLSVCYSRMRSKGSRFTLGVWGLRECSLDVVQPFATVRNGSQPGRMV